MEEMNELFYQNAYLTDFEAEVLCCSEGKHGYETVLSNTAFYPEGGGQPGDHGTLNGIRVLDTRRKNGTVVHITEAPLEAGTAVQGTIDWDRRFDLMQQHTGEHIFSGIVHEFFGYDNIGFHLGEDTITLDFSGPLDWKDLRRVEDKANAIVWRNEEVLVLYPDAEELRQLEYRSKKELERTVRIVKIPDADTCACCGTHLKRTGEVGLIKVLSSAARKNGTRVEILCGARALAYVQAVTDQNLEVSHLLSAKVKETAAAVEHMQKDLIDTRHRLKSMVLDLLNEKLPEIPEGSPLYTLFTDGIGAQEMRIFANRIMEERGVKTAAVFSGNPERYQYVIISHTTDLKPLSRLLNERFAGQGGGKSEMIQGSLKGEPDAVRQLMEETL